MVWNIFRRSVFRRSNSTFSLSTLSSFRRLVIRRSVIRCWVPIRRWVQFGVRSFVCSVIRCSVILCSVFRRSVIRCSVIRHSVFRRSLGESKLGWVESGVNRWVILQYWGAVHYFLVLKGHHLVFRIKRFAATCTQIIGNVGKNWWSAENGV